MARVAVATEAGDAVPVEPRSVVARAFANLYGYNAVQRIEVRARQADGREYTRRAQVVRRAAADAPNRMLIRFLGPGELRGVGFLLLERPDFSYDAFLYQPALRRVRRVSLAQRHDSFFGTDLYFEDLESKRIAQWDSRLLREERVDERRAWVIELRPRSEYSGYERIVAWFDQEVPIMLKAQFYRGDTLLKTMDLDANEVERSGGFYIPTKLTFRGTGGSETVVEFSETELRADLPDELFTASALEFGDERRDAR